MSSPSLLRELVKEADVVIGAVLVAGAKAPKLLTKDMLKTMKKGSVIVDVAIDQGGCFETSHPTTHGGPDICSRRGYTLLRGQYAGCRTDNFNHGTYKCNSSVCGANRK